MRLYKPYSIGQIGDWHLVCGTPPHGADNMGATIMMTMNPNQGKIVEGVGIVPWVEQVNYDSYAIEALRKLTKEDESVAGELEYWLEKV